MITDPTDQDGLWPAPQPPPTGPTGSTSPTGAGRTPLYPRLLRLRNIRLSGWQRTVLGDGPVAVAVVLVLSDVASAWTLAVLPLGVALVVKAHDVLAGLLGAPAAPAESDGAVPAGTAPSDEQQR